MKDKFEELACKVIDQYVEEILKTSLPLPNGYNHRIALIDQLWKELDIIKMSIKKYE